MNETDIEKFIAETERDLALAREFLGMWKRRAGKASGSTVRRTDSIQTPLFPPTEKQSKADIVRAAIDRCQRIEYTIFDLEKVTEAMGTPIPGGEISRIMSRLADDGYAVRKQKGTG